MAVVRQLVKKHLRVTGAVSVVLSILLVMQPAQAAVVTLKNGDRITGEVLRMSDGKLVFATTLLGEVTIPWGSVSELESDKNANLQLNDGTLIRGPVTMDDAGLVVVRKNADSQPVTLARENVRAVNPPVDEPRVKYTVRLDVGGTANRGNSSDDQLNLNGEFVAKTIKDRYTLGAEVQEAKSAAERTTSDRRYFAQYDIFLENKNYVLFKAKHQSDPFANLNSRSSLGVGYGYQFIDTHVTQFSGEAGISYVFENYTTEPRTSFPAMSLGLKYDRKFFDDKLVYFQNLSMDSRMDGPRNTLLRNRMGFRVPIAKGLNVSTQLDVDYNNTPPVGKKKTDTALIFNVGYAY